MVNENSLILVHFVERQLEGWTFQRAHWPLHITLVPWFSVEDEEAVIRSLERVAAEITPLTLHVGKIKMFGPKANIPVNIIEDQAAGRALHEMLLNTLEQADSSFDEKTYTRQKYVPHITRHKADKRHSSEGEIVVVKSFHLVRLIDQHTCRVEQEFTLKV